MERELKPLLIELCYLAAKRNEINTRRHRARFRKNYYEHAIRVVEAHNKSNSDLRHIESQMGFYRKPDNYNDPMIVKLEKRKTDILLGMEYICGKYINHKKPLKWQKMGLHKLRSLSLQGEGEYAMAKHETMEFSIKHRARVKHIVTALNCSLRYDNGALNAIYFKDGKDSLSLAEIEHYAEQFELNKAVEGMLR